MLVTTDPNGNIQIQVENSADAQLLVSAFQMYAYNVQSKNSLHVAFAHDVYDKIVTEYTKDVVLDEEDRKQEF